MAYDKALYNKHKEAHIRASKKYYYKNREHVAIQRASLRYNISYQEASQLFELRKKGCEVCQSHARLGIDHDHKTGRIRGVLCNRCNLALGYVDDNLVLLNSLKAYLCRNR